MSVLEIVQEGVRNARSARPTVDRPAIEARLRHANRAVGRSLGPISWSGSLPAFVRTSADLVLDGWTMEDEGPLSPSHSVYDVGYEDRFAPIASLELTENRLWEIERSAHSTARLTRSQRLPVWLYAIESPSFASASATLAINAEAMANEAQEPRASDFAGAVYWRGSDPMWLHSCAVASLPFLTEAAECFAAGLFAAALFRRGAAVRTILLGRPRLRTRRGLVHAQDRPAVIYEDGTERWFWDGLEVPERIVAARNDLTAVLVAGIENQELRRSLLDRMGWPRFLETADAELKAQDDFGKLWTTQVRLGGESTCLVEVVNATQERDGTHRRYFLRVPPTVRTAREGVAWTFGFENTDEYILAAAS